MVQSLPSDRQVLVTMDRNDGIAIFIVWAHQVCGLNVLVRQPNNQSVRETNFGSGPAHVIVEYGFQDRGNTGSSMTLLDVVNDDKLFVFSTEEDEPVVDATVKKPAKGIGRRWLERSWEVFLDSSTNEAVDREAGITEVMNVSVAFALLVALRSVKSRYAPSSARYGRGGLPDIGHRRSNYFGHLYIHDDIKCIIPSSRIFEAAEFLFGERKVTAETVKPYELAYRDMSLSNALVLENIGTIYKIFGLSTKLLESLQQSAVNLSVLILAFANVSDLEDAATLPLTDRLDLLDQNSLVCQIQSWNGETPIPVHDSLWYEILVAMTKGHTLDIHFTTIERTSLVSDRGWSVFLSNFSNADPSFVGMLYSLLPIKCR